jgi:hypothetical protein
VLSDKMNENLESVIEVVVPVYVNPVRVYNKKKSSARVTGKNHINFERVDAQPVTLL